MLDTRLEVALTPSSLEQDADSVRGLAEEMAHTEFTGGSPDHTSLTPSYGSGEETDDFLPLRKQMEIRHLLAEYSGI